MLHAQMKPKSQHIVKDRIKITSREQNKNNLSEALVKLKKKILKERRK
jgi:hypothetical protein